MVFFSFFLFFSPVVQILSLETVFNFGLFQFLDEVVLSIGRMISTVSTVGLRELSNPEF